MPEYVLAINPTTEGTGTHDPSVVLFRDGELVFGAEEERFTREKHAERTFPGRAIQAALEACDITLEDIERVCVSWDPRDKARYDLRFAARQSNLRQKAYETIECVKDYSAGQSKIGNKLADVGTPVPPIETLNHHYCHAASAFYPSGFDDALVLSIDGRGERESTVVWRGDESGLERIRTYDYPNSLGGFYGLVTRYLGYRENNGEGKIMGLAPYGTLNTDIEEKFRTLIETGVDYDVVALNNHDGKALQRLEELFGRPKKQSGGEFDQWEKDFARVTQHLLETIVADIVDTYCEEQNLSKVALAGGVALNCKMNKRLMELDTVEEIFVQPVANDAGAAIGAGYIGSRTPSIEPMHTVYWGPSYTTAEIEGLLDVYKIPYTKPTDLERAVAEKLAGNQLVGWFQGAMEMGPRALGNRSILADPRSTESRDLVNKFVKNREEWRPFAPAMLEERVGEYLFDAEPSPYMIKTFDVREERQSDIQAVLHAGDGTTRPQTVREDQNPRYYRLIREFEDITGVPVVLNTSFNDHGEPIVNTPKEAIKDFFGMGLDVLVLEDIVVEKQIQGAQVATTATSDQEHVPSDDDD